jgi:hypothetical protein
MDGTQPHTRHNTQPDSGRVNREAVLARTIGLDVDGPEFVGNSREARRARRLRDLEIGRVMAMNMMARLEMGSAGQLFGDAQAIVEKINPYSAMTQMMQAVRRGVALEERIDEDPEDKAARLAKESAARDRAAKAVAAPPLRSKTKAVRRAVRSASYDMDTELDREEREDLLDDLFDDYDEDEDFSGDTVEIVMQLCCDFADRLGVLNPIEQAGILDSPANTTPEQRHAIMRAVAEGYIDRIAPKPPPDG